MIRIKRKNPIDEKFLKKIKIKKQKSPEDPDDLIYTAFYDNEIVAYVFITPEAKCIDDVNIEDKFQRKGLATFLYDYIENDLNIKLQPSQTLSSSGKAFWQNRLKKSNPTDLKFLSKIKIRKTKTKYYIHYEALLNDIPIATADFLPSDNSVASLWVNSPYRRKGLASFMYNTIENDQKVSLQPSKDLLPDGRRFWENRLRNKPEKMGLLYR